MLSVHLDWYRGHQRREVTRKLKVGSTSMLGSQGQNLDVGSTVSGGWKLKMEFSCIQLIIQLLAFFDPNLFYFLLTSSCESENLILNSVNSEIVKCCN